jgi:hypothetical protein
VRVHLAHAHHPHRDTVGTVEDQRMAAEYHGIGDHGVVADGAGDGRVGRVEEVLEGGA